MSARILIQLLAIATFFSIGCAGGHSLYQPLAVRLAAPRSLRVAAVHELAQHEGWNVFTEHARGGYIEAYANETNTQRDHIVIDSTRGNAVIEIRTELRATDGEWMSSDTVCSSYSYSRETLLAAQLDDIIRSHRAPQ